MAPRALLFDMDGTLVDSDTVHFQTFQVVAQRWGIQFDRAFFHAQMSGHSNDVVCRNLFPDLSVGQHQQIIQEKEDLFRARVAEVPVISGLMPLLDWARGQGIGMAVVSNAPKTNILALTRALGLDGYFQTLVSGEDVARGKPDPLPYQTALDHLGVSAEQAVAFEDAPPGLRAAVAAGIPTVGVLTSQAADTLTQAGAALCVADFADAGLMAFLEQRG